MVKKGQAAMEFLMTYGWAILVVLIAIGALAYFGVLNPARFLPNSCTLFPGLACTEFKVADGADEIRIFVRNGIGDTLNVQSGAISTWWGQSANPAACTGVKGCLDNGAVCAVPPGTTAVDLLTATYPIGDGAQGIIVWTGCGGTGTSGSRLKTDLSFTYILGTTGLSHTRTGSLVAQVEP